MRLTPCYSLHKIYLTFLTFLWIQCLHKYSLISSYRLPSPPLTPPLTSPNIRLRLSFDSYSISAPLSPSLQPLQYITPEVVASYLVQSAQYTVLSALLPTNREEALAIFISEGLSGFLGGFAAKVVALLDGNRNNRYSSLVNGEASGAYFGTVGALRSLAQLAGLSSIFVNLLSLVLAASLSEVIKIRNKALTSIRTRVGKGPSMYELMKFRRPSMREIMRFSRTERSSSSPTSPFLPSPSMTMGSMTEIEIRSDLVKWLLISLCLSLTGSMASLEEALVVGVVAGVGSQVVREKNDEETSNEIRRYNRFLKQRLNRFILQDRKKESSNNSNSKINNPYNPYKRENDSNSQTRQRTRRRGRLRKTLEFFFMQRPMQAMKDMTEGMGLKPKAPTSMTRPAGLVSNSTEYSDFKGLEVDFAATRFARAAIEGATQLVTYEASRRYVMEVSPYFQNPETLQQLYSTDIAPSMLTNSLNNALTEGILNLNLEEMLLALHLLPPS